MVIRDIMSSPVVTCPATSTLDHAARLMWEFDCGVVPVLNDQGRMIGVVTDRDICMAAYTQGLPLGKITVTTAMARPIVAGHTDDSLAQAEELMRANQSRRLPVLDQNSELVGLLSMNDLARLAAKDHHTDDDRLLVDTLAAVCEPRQDPHQKAVASVRWPIVSH